MAGRFVKTYEKLLEWRWFKNANTLQLFLYLLLKANYRNSTFQGIPVKRGQVITSISKLGQATGQTDRQIRDNLKHLEMTGEVTSETTNRYRIITIVRYDYYQASDKQNDKQPDKQLDKQMTGKTTSKVTTSIEYIEPIEKNRTIEPPTVVVSAKRFTPPTAEDVLDFCLENGLSIDVDRFMDYYTSNGWRVGRNPMKDWKATVRNWAKSDQEKQRTKVASNPATNYSQRDYSNEQDAAMERMMRWKPEDDDGSTI